MSRVGKMPVTIPGKVKIGLEGRTVKVEGPRGKLVQELVSGIDVDISATELVVTRQTESKDHRSLHGLMRALLANAVIGVTEGYVKNLEIHGVGYRAEVKGREVHFALGYSHPVIFPLPEGIEVEIDRNTKITVKGIDRQMVGQVAANMRALRKPDAYKAKGVRYADEIIRRKVGKSGVK